MDSRATLAVRRLRRGLALASMSSLLAGGVCAHADPGAPDPAPPSQQQVDEAKAQVALASHRVEDVTAALDAADARLTEVGKRAGIAGEKANAAKIELDRRTAAATAAQGAADLAAADRATAQGNVDGLAAQLWMAGGSLDGLEILLLAQGTTRVADRAAGLDLLTSYRGAVLGDASRAAQRAAETSRVAATARLQQEAAARQAQQAAEAARTEATAAATQKAEVARRQQALLRELAALRKTSVEVETRRRDALQAAAAKAAAEAAARAAAEAAARARSASPAPQRPGVPPTPRSAPVPVPDAGPAPAPSGGAAAALAYARAQLGKPYVWGGEGPSGYDCSGLVKMAWGAAGVPLMHQTNAQWGETAHVPLDQAQPGDLVFYGRVGGDIYHVGLYLGGGQMIHAPTFGEPVKVSTIYFGELIGYAGRVR